ncbi:hypothetical protein FQN57_005122 [Myotisia sp. PD_48]|nr:hypothetical protein FQN57_005122 [Myotisia sp. PD_48]
MAAALRPDFSCQRSSPASPDEFPEHFYNATRSRRTRLLSFGKLRPWQQENRYIRTGYRPASHSYLRSLWSILRLHNETGSIYTHILPAIGFIAAEAYLYTDFEMQYPEASWIDKFVFSFFLFTAIACFGISAVYHTFGNHSKRVSGFLVRLDYTGIVGLILGHIVSGTYMVFYCDSRWQAFYSGMLLTLSIKPQKALTLGGISGAILLSHRFQSLQFRPLRISTFVNFGFSAAAPLIHGTVLLGLQHMVQFGLWYYLVESSIHALAVLIYATRLPESLKPGRFDMWFNSHQIFHSLAVLATVIHTLALWNVFDRNYMNNICRQPAVHVT